MPTCALVNHDCKMIPLVTQVDIETYSKDIITSEKYPPLEVVEQAPQEVDTHNKSFGVVENGYNSYFMFASDLPSMGGTCTPLQKTSSSQESKVYDKKVMSFQLQNKWKDTMSKFLDGIVT